MYGPSPCERLNAKTGPRDFIGSVYGLETSMLEMAHVVIGSSSLHPASMNRPCVEASDQPYGQSIGPSTTSIHQKLLTHSVISSTHAVRLNAVTAIRRYRVKRESCIDLSR